MLRKTLFLALMLSFCSATALAEAQFVDSPLEGKLMTLKVLDVGQGDCLYVESPEGLKMLIDAGPQGSKNEIVEWLEANKITRLDYLLVTHGHSDHVGKMKKVLNAVQVDTVISSGFFHPSGINESILELMKEKNIPMKVVATGDSFKLGASLEFQVLYPDKDIGLPALDINDTSIVVKLTHGKVSFMLTGDAEHFTEEILLKRRPKELDADILKVGHHGSETASGKEFLEAVTPKVALISVGENSKFDHPHKSALDRLSERGIKILRTDRDGTITITTDGKKVRIETEKKAPVSALPLVSGKAA